MAYGGTKVGTSGSYSQSGMQGSGKTNRINGGRGVCIAGYGSTPNANQDTVDFWSIQVPANAVDFGNLAQGVLSDHHGASDGQRFVGIGGSGANAPVAANFLDYASFMTPANMIDFGDLVVARRHACAISGGTRGITSGGYAGPPGTTAIQEYFTLATTGNAIQWGTRTESLYDLGSGSDGSRGVMFGGEGPESTTIDYVSIYQLGDAIDFGEMLLEGRMNSGTQHGSRGYRNGGDVNDSAYDGIEMFEIGTFGSAVDYGEITQARYYAAGSSDGIRNVAVGGNDAAGYTTMDYYNTFALTTALDFGDLSQSRGRCGSAAGG